MRYIAMAIAMIGLMFMTSCNIGCEAEKIAVAGISTAIVSQLQCKNRAEIEKDVKALLDKTGICKQQGPIADLVCPVVGELVVSQLSNVVPADWECDTSATQKSLKDVIVSACKLLPI